MPKIEASTIDFVRRAVVSAASADDGATDNAQHNSWQSVSYDEMPGFTVWKRLAGQYYQPSKR